MERLHELHDEFGQSPWLDNLKRGYLTSGELAALRRPRHPRPHVEPDDLPEGDPGLEPTTTSSSPSSSAERHRSIDDYWAMVLARHPRRARRASTPVYDESDGGRRLRVASRSLPSLAHDSDGTDRRRPRSAPSGSTAAT